MVETIASKEVYHIMDGLTVEVNVLQNPYQFELSQLFQMATRINKRRSFLFVSKVLGKHLAVDPNIPLVVGKLLAMRYVELVHGVKDPRMQAVVHALQTKSRLSEVLADIERQPILLDQPLTVMGFAETATALGHAVFSAFGEQTKYIHTTREQIQELTSVINFEEEHSHATSHRVYASNSAFFDNDSEVVLVDDEITTGKTAINIIRTMKEQYPQKTRFTVVSILDWRSHEHRERYEQLEEELNITIHTVALLDGMITVSGEPVLSKENQSIRSSYLEPTLSFLPSDNDVKTSEIKGITSISTDGTVNRSPYLLATGRFGLTRAEESLYSNELQAVAEYVKKQRKGSRTLVIGTGEFMYVPMKIAAQLGENVFFQSTTRSPIYQRDIESYTIQQKFSFDSPENTGTTNFLYNIKQNQYDELIILVERMHSEDDIRSLVEELKRTNITTITVVMMTDICS
ncbi:phosphoribosyltransferase family protein [Peribacillus asahii]|uniref:phosphoribosyltransferase family protein n=1 Tax=Peribacillus asahii TaxID=228899 RepID=UPI002079A10B|nr:phosphoribosyltransferase family protein [Peribacillus asahii]USK60484.1 phosphoribosyltransferase family protein [Peribacillus asahii]